MIGDVGAVIGATLANNHNVIEQNIAFGTLGNEKIGGDYVAGMKLAENVRVFDLVGHGHGIHEAGDGFVIDGDLGCGRIGGNDLAAQLEGLDRGSGC